MKIKGFTIIELLVVISIMLVVLGGGIAAFSVFNDKQQITTAAKDLQTMLRSAQVKARSGEGAGDCTDAGQKLSGYRVYANSLTAIDNNSVAIMERVCDGGATLLNSSSVLTGTTVSDFDMEFISLRGGVTGAGTIIINGNAASNVFEFEVSEGGEITEGAYQD